MALYQRSEQYAQDALKTSVELKLQLEKLIKSIEGCKFSAHAYSVLEGEETEGESSPKGPRSRKVHAMSKCVFLISIQFCQFYRKTF